MTGKTFNILLIFLAIVLAVILCVLIMVMVQKPQNTTLVPTASATEVSQPTQISTTDTTTVPTTVAPTTQPYVPAISPDKVGIYIPAENGTKARKWITEFHGPRSPKTDIDCFEVFAAQDSRLEGTSFSAIWRSVWEAYDGWQSAKIGYHLRFTLSDGTEISQTIRKPSDAASFSDYLEVYIYDDVHQTGWYSHLEDSDLKDETVMTSIKLHCGSLISQVGDIELTAFIYNGEDCFNTAGDYIGAVKQTILITQ